jgi:signal transduction histidine kinase
MESDRQDRKIILRLFSTPPDRVVMQIVDNGIGISPEALSRIFEHGHITHKSGQGFGLHTSSLAAHELGGNLTVQSDGPGLGATSTLEIPCSPQGLT